MAGIPYTEETWVEKATSIHGDDYDYSDLEWVNNQSAVKITCNNCRTTFRFAQASEHLRKPPRTRGCPISCRDESIMRIKDHPILSAELDLEATGKLKSWNWMVDPLWLTTETNHKLSWICSECNHSWSAIRYGERSCPACAGKEVCNFDGWNSVQFMHPNIVKIWSPENTLGPEEVTFGSGKKYYFSCPEKDPCDRLHYCQLNNKVRGAHCPYCLKDSDALTGASVWEQHPDLEKFLSNPKNRELDLPTKSDKILTWVCQQCNTEHENSIRNQVYRKKRELCNPCSAKWVANNRPQTTIPYSKFLDRANQIHDYGYEYDESSYVNSSSHVRMKHLKCGIWESRLATSHLQGTGCSNCAEYGFDPHRPADYYVHEISETSTGELFCYKAGISGDWSGRIQVLRRHLPDGYRIVYLRHIRFELGTDARDFERSLLAVDSIRALTEEFQGGTELFSSNPLEYASSNGMMTGLRLE